MKPRSHRKSNIQRNTEMLTRWKATLNRLFIRCSLKQICYKFVDDEPSKQALWIAECEILRHAFLPRFSPCCESCETGSAPDWTLLSLTSAVISHGCWLSNNDCLSGRLSAAQNLVLSVLTGKHIFVQVHIKHCSRTPLQGMMGIWVPCQRATGVGQVEHGSKQYKYTL